MASLLSFIERQPAWSLVYLIVLGVIVIEVVQGIAGAISRKR